MSKIFAALNLKSVWIKVKSINERLTAIENRLAALEVRIPSPEEREADSRSTALLAAGWLARSPLWKDFDHEQAPLNDTAVIGPSLAEAEQSLAALEPAVFPIWKQLHENDTPSYEDAVEASCSHWNHKYARLFGSFVGLFARGRLLDIGCGVNGRPSYLAGYPANLITGLDPRPSQESVDFEYVQGFNEFLPWKDGSFNTVVSGTSLDHVLSLDRSFTEIRRVLAPGGNYLVWIASIPDAKPYEPRSEIFEPVDRFHLFHFDRVWIEPLLRKYFSMEDVCVISQPGFDHIFYRLVKNTE